MCKDKTFFKIACSIVQISLFLYQNRKNNNIVCYFCVNNGLLLLLL